MASQFFSKLGEQLCAIKNSPFYQLGRPKPQLHDDNIIHTELSYNPDRLFNRQKYEEEQKNIEDEDLLEIKKEEIKAQDRIEFQILKKATLEDYDKRIHDLQNELQRGNTKLAPTIFKVPRSVCLHCHKCAVYKCNLWGFQFSEYRNESLHFLSCNNCKCPMNAHAQAKFLPTHRPSVWKYIKNKEVRDEYLNFDFMVLGFKIYEDANTEQEFWKTSQILSRLGLKIQRGEIIEKTKFQFKLLRCYLLASGEEPALLEGMLQLAETIQKIGGFKQKIEVGDVFKEQLNILEKIMKTIRNRSLSNVEEDDRLAIFLVRHDESYPSAAELKLAIKQSQDEMQIGKLVHASSNKKQSLLQTQQFFPNYFLLHNRLFILPDSSQNSTNAYQFQDYLDYSGYSNLIQQIKNIRRDKLETLLDFLSYNQLTYILGKNVVSQNIKNFPLFYSLKSGMPVLKHRGYLSPFLQIKNAQSKSKIVKQLLPDYMLGQRCVIVFRPQASFLNETVINILRINGFVIIQRSKKRLTQHQAHFLSALEHVPPQQFQQYIQFMTSGVCEIMLISKRGGLFQAQALLNSNSRALATINPVWLKQQPVFQIKKGTQIFRQEMNCYQRKEKEVFANCGDLLAIQKCLFGVAGKKSIIQNCRTNELIKIQVGKYDGQFKGTSRQRDQILKGLRSDSFNYILFNSKSDKSTQELASLFFPQTTLFQSAIVILKPAYFHLIDSIKDIILQHRYHFIFHKTLQFSKILAHELLEPLQKIQLGGQSFEQIIQSFMGKRVSLLCVSKIGANKELLSLLASYSFLPSRTAILPHEDQALLQQALIPVWTNKDSFLKLFNRHLISLEQAVQLIVKQGEGSLKNEEKMELIQYFVGSMLGVRPTDLALNTSLGRLTFYNTIQRTALYQSWFYSSLSQVSSQHVPLLFQYRSFGVQTLVLQTFSGQPFMAKIINEYVNQLNLHKKDQQREEEKKKKRGSLILFLWAKKIFNLAQRLAGIDGRPLPNIEVQGWGSLIYKNNQHSGEHTQNVALSESKVFLQKLLSKYERNRNISSNIRKMLDSRILVQRLKPQNRRLLPEFTQVPLQEGLRVLESSTVGKIYLKDQFQMIDPDNEKQNFHNKDLYGLALFRADPYLAPKYKFFADLFLFFQRWKEEALEHRQVFADILDHLKALVHRFQDLQFLEFQIYFQALKKVEINQLPQQYLRLYPNLRKNKMKTAIDSEQAPGKNRKFLEQKLYFKPSNQHSEQQLQDMRQKYTHYNLKTLQQPLQNHVLNKADDYLHQAWNNQEHFINLLREQQSGKKIKKNEQKGVFVQYEKKINQNEQKLKEHLQNQLNKIHNQREEQILKDNGLDPDLWYKRVKQHPNLKAQSKVDSAIMKQLQKLNQFKQTFNKTS